MKKQIFDYEKVDEVYTDRRYYGFHRRNGRLAIDTHRLKRVRFDSYFPEVLFATPRNTHYFVPKKVHRRDYKVNILIDFIKNLRETWRNEYIPFINSIKTQNDVYQEERLSRISFTASMDDLDQINEDAFLASLSRIEKHREVVNSIYFQYIQKISIDIQRAIAIILENDPESCVSNDFTFEMLKSRIQASGNPKEPNPLYSFKSYKWFNLLLKIDNFLKHNSRNAYLKLANNSSEKDKELKRFYREFVVLETNDYIYKTGYYAGNWLALPENFIETILDELYVFAAELCSCLYNEDINEAQWNYEDYLLAILNRDCINNIYQ